MVKFFSAEFFAQIQVGLSNDPKWQEDTKALRTSVKLTSTGQPEAAAYLLRVEEGMTTISQSEPAAQAEFSFEGSYDTWTKVAKGEVDLQAAVLKGLLKFKGSITKILMYKDRFLAIVRVMRSIPVEF
ncbi:MAG: SCP2 sterol-binding domain-containing protein [Nitrososphaerota archaeon]|jgi:putative sterol carrier protein|nr:SCP2 sterol-binding domain-containing protein [Nitrososphaerota archaeon]MDG6967009.1 SCP2 sterol-binding domain-containing protein [Nitrososphaerota archaeon]MDG6979020.1 SCP2 sterol-binding domain-containing protein [Nitrososphaerota archaeon]MDG7020463.1 SCP2 sterol-binding domain-containing protein [Nitrososphaerota archaeon]MDG7022161.1 SCP2 sterol-binding domain-containing protein [Nitrososphaerota archaeon]